MSDSLNHQCPKTISVLRQTSNSASTSSCSRFHYLYGCEIGDNTRSEPSSNSRRSARFGKNSKSQATRSFVKVLTSRTVFSSVIASHSSMTAIHVRSPPDGELQTEQDWGCRANNRKKRSLDRFWIHDPLKCCDRRKTTHPLAQAA